jgi:hypothetical protein
MATNAGLPRSRARLVTPAPFFQYHDGPSTYKFGRNADVDAAEDFIVQGGNLFVPAAAAATTIVSSNADDAQNGAGLDQLKVSGLDANWDFIEETVTMHATDGTNAVTLTNQFLRVFRVAAVQAGSAGSTLSDATGNIDVKHGTDVLCRIPAGATTSQHAAYSVPRGYVGEIVAVDLIAEGGPTLKTTAGIMSRDPSAALNPWVERSNHYLTDGEQFTKEFLTPILIPEMNDVVLRAFTVSAVNAILRGGFDIRVYKKL